MQTKDTEPRIEFGSKAETLDRLQNKLRSAGILPCRWFTCGEWKSNRKKVITQLENEQWSQQKLIVRSSSIQEDRDNGSQAGRFLSVPDVLGIAQFGQAVDDVISSYADTAQDIDQVLVQPMLANVEASGVAFSCDPNTGSPYRVINIDDRSSSTNSVTSGMTNSLRTFYCLRNNESKQSPHFVQSVLLLIDELEVLFESKSLDIEFAFSDSKLFLLQCRPLCLKMPSVEESALRPHLERVANKVELLSAPHPYLLGDRSVFGIMPDWNPAEIIGVRPRPLALSLYQELITDSIWAYQRDNYGYRNLRSFPLLVSFCGQPYIDVRVDFNSFIPADLDADLGHRLVNHYTDSLVSRPSDHDKVEFAVLFTCYTFDMPDRILSLQSAGFSKQDCSALTESLRNLTNRIIRQKEGLWERDINKIKRLQLRQSSILNSNLDLTSKIYWLLEDCKRYGTLPFAGLARAGFIAVQLLKSLVTTDVLSEADYDAFMMTLETVSSRMTRDLSELSRNAFLNKYGHLRPGTYDILSPRYDEAPDHYFDWSKIDDCQLRPTQDFPLGLRKLKTIENLLDEHQLEHNILGFFDFIRSAIEGREFSKFVFTKSLSDALLLFKELGAQYGFSEEDCSFASIHAIKGMYSSSADAKGMLADAIERGKRNYETTCRVQLPPLIVNPTEVFAFELPPSEPNFITQKMVTAKVAILSETSDLSGAIVFIPNADPGYDWIFSKGIAGLITMYGGVNSHMAIRAGELGIPAVIGAGESYYLQWEAASMLQLDCRNRQVVKLK